jgi:ribosomal protein S18 acetylase RimI-like enzyme
MELSFAIATDDDVAAITLLRAAVAADLTRRYGAGHWSCVATEKAVLRDIKTSQVLLARHTSRGVATLRLATKKPWAIDPKYFSPCTNVLYLTDMAVDPSVQRCGIGRRCLKQARTIAAASSADAIRLDAYDGEAGAGEFYRKCGFHERGRITFRKTPLVFYELLL